MRIFSDLMSLNIFLKCYNFLYISIEPLSLSYELCISIVSNLKMTNLSFIVHICSFIWLILCNINDCKTCRFSIVQFNCNYCWNLKNYFVLSFSIIVIFPCIMYVFIRSCFNDNWSYKPFHKHSLVLSNLDRNCHVY